MDLSLHPSMVDSCSYSSVMTSGGAPSSSTSSASNMMRTTTTTTSHHYRTHHHGSAVFVNIGQQLTTQQQRDMHRGGGHDHQNPAIWYEGFDDGDWEQFRQVGQMVLNAILDPERNTSSSSAANNTTSAPRLVLALTDDDLSETGPTMSESSPPPPSPSGAVKAQDVLPAALLCPLCQDVMVGATVLDCGCAASAVCAMCWQAHVDFYNTHPQATTIIADQVVESGFIWVSAASPPPTPAPPASASSLSSCPTCQQPVHRVVVCHALEAAIQEFLRQLPPSTQHDPLKRHYQRRFQVWRDSVLQHEAQERATQEEQYRNLVLAQLIAQEEEILWNCRRHKLSFWQKCGTILQSEPFLLVVAAAVSFGLAMKAGGRN